MQKLYKSHPEMLALLYNSKLLKEDLETTIKVRSWMESVNHNGIWNPRSWDIAVNNYEEAVWIRENRY